MCNDVFVGINANKNEYSYYTEFTDCRVMPTLQQLLCGCVIVQVRGTDITSDELEQETPFSGGRTTINLSAEILTPSQFCRHPNGQLALVDYGRLETIDLLRKINT